MDSRERVDKALTAFIEPFRQYIVTLIIKKVGKDWVKTYSYKLSDKQKDFWNEGIKKGKDPISLIDWPHLKSFTLQHRELLRDDFGRKTNSLPTWIEEIIEIRNAWAHHDDLDSEDVDRALGNMIRIFQILEMNDSENEIRELRKPAEKNTVKKENQPKQTTLPLNDVLIPWFRNVRPHKDIQEGHLDESVFAANLAEVSDGVGRDIYTNSDTFFEKTFFTAGLKNLAKRVIHGLNGNADAENRVISLQTGFGGGKTHSLISLYHIAKAGKSIADNVFVDELLEVSGKPEFKSANIAVFTNTTNDPVQGREINGVHINTLWGEIAYQLGGKEVYEIIKANDEQKVSPKGLLKKVLEKTKPALILIDELADYCVAASGVTVGTSSLSDQTVSFMQELSEAVAETEQCILVATLPASIMEVAASPKSQAILTTLSNRMSRVGADTKPVADEEIFEVVRRRLFEDLGDEKAINQVINAYLGMYTELTLSHELPQNVSRPEYRDALRKAYPFHPELIDIFRTRWASNHDFQRTRGVLRLLASIVADLWKRQNSLSGVHAMIHTSDINFANLDALTGQLKKLWGNGYDAVITADVSGSSSNAFRIDKEKTEFNTYSIAQGVASTILLGTFGGNAGNQGMDISEIKLSVLKPLSYNHNNVNSVIDELESVAHYLYYSSSGSSKRKYWFHAKPNVNILINQLKNDVKKSEIKSEIIKRIENKTMSISSLNILVTPADDIPEQKKPTLIILPPENMVTFDKINSKTKKLIEKIATKKGNGDRIYRNTILFLAATEQGISTSESDIRDYIACKKVRDEYKSQLEKDQIDDIKQKIDTFNTKINESICTAYSVIIKHSSANGIERIDIKKFINSFDKHINSTVIDELKREEWLLESVGLGLLRNNNLLPTVDTPIKAKDIYEAFLRFDDKPMITGTDAVQNSILRYCQNGEFAIASGETADNYTKTYYKETVPFFDITDAIFWIIDKTQHITPEIKFEEGGSSSAPEKIIETNPNDDPTKYDPSKTETIFKSVTISGNIGLDNYNQIFTSFIMPLSNNKVEIEVKIKGNSTQLNPLTETSQEYKVLKESAKQLGLNIETE